jgi:hypothetical protein
MKIALLSEAVYVDFGQAKICRDVSVEWLQARAIIQTEKLLPTQ